ncbi:hypothetical protein [Exiguobacterium sp. RIT594]|uniref:hypothetical protein n=1 Tax=Exiguobacterium sp. RIT594 TaxID=2282449 RepID=UPI000DF7F41E|nr:hypothetical protein [Exiguobacterium sp. RIT594]RDB34007.1 hypothetical protein DVG79_04840 [Exiguobacterium sp. RIT594]
MKRWQKIGLWIGGFVITLLIVFPLLSQVVFSNETESGAIRHYLYEQGHPYQSYTAILDKRMVDPDYGRMYDVVWYDYDSETGMTPTICYSKKTAQQYSVSCGTGP